MKTSKSSSLLSALALTFLAAQAQAQSLSDNSAWVAQGFSNPEVLEMDGATLHAAASQTTLTHGFELTSVLLRTTSWTKEQVLTRAAAVVPILAQCGVNVTKFSLVTIDPPGGNVNFVGQFRENPPDYLDDPNKIEVALAKMLPMKTRPVIFYVQALKYQNANSNLAEGFPASAKGCPILDTIFMSPAAIGSEHNYSPLYSIEAHELGHVLGKLPHRYPPHLPGPLKNLMAADPFKGNEQLNEAQCEKIRNSPLVHPLLK